MTLETPKECWDRVKNTAILDVVERGFARIIAEEVELPDDLPIKAPDNIPSETVIYTFTLATVKGRQFVMCEHDGKQLTIAKGRNPKGAKK